MLFTACRVLRCLRNSLTKHILTVPRRTPIKCKLCVSASIVGCVGVWSHFGRTPRLLLARCAPLVELPKEDTTPTETSEKLLLFQCIGTFWWSVVIVLRCISLVVRFFPLLITYPLTLVSAGLQSAWWTALLWTMESAGPTFIKLGQWASTRRDLFSQRFCDRFSVFHRSVTIHRWWHTEQRMAEAFGQNWRELFIQFDHRAKPIGSGCVAQVYKAILNPKVVPRKRRDELYQKLPDTGGNRRGRGERGGIPVAVKVCHPQIDYQVERDLTILRGAAAFFTFCLPNLRWLSLADCVEEFAKLMEKQLDLRIEAECLERFGRNFSLMKSVIIPKPVWPYVRRQVLVETFEEGDHISKYIDKKHFPKRLREKLAALGVTALLKMIFIDNFIHGDLHPGNVLVQNADIYLQQNACPSDPGETEDVPHHAPPLRLVLLDVGITASMAETDRHKFVEVFKAVILGKGERVAQLFLTQSRHSHCPDPARFTAEMAELVRSLRSEAFSLGKVRVGVLLTRVFGLLVRHRIQVEGHFASVLLALAVLEGLGRSLDPQLDIIRSAKPFLMAEPSESPLPPNL